MWYCSGIACLLANTVVYLAVGAASWSRPRRYPRICVHSCLNMGLAALPILRGIYLRLIASSVSVIED